MFQIPQRMHSLLYPPTLVPAYRTFNILPLGQTGYKYYRLRFRHIWQLLFPGNTKMKELTRFLKLFKRYNYNNKGSDMLKFQV